MMFSPVSNGYICIMVQAVGERLYWHMDGIDRKIYEAVQSLHFETQKCDESNDTETKDGRVFKEFSNTI